ncbi:MAG TPA: SDR family NAD(P)-dependent oxidoreductase [Vicinamibacteria bacterium]|nr:SDR family NAD(P)-dependent oxidoreductase [Vicinamibacteria bacterium]
MRLANKTALVTGAGSGIGRAICHSLVAEGARPFVNDVVKERAEATARELGIDADGVLVADVAVSKRVERMFEAIESIDILVNNAGIADPAERWREGSATLRLSDADWTRMIAVHLHGTFYCTREALKRMVPKRAGSIVNISSTAALIGLPDAPHYAAAKAGILGFTRSVALEVAHLGIRVNAVAPGYARTPMTAGMSEELRRRSQARIPLGRWATPEEIAAAVLFLASDDASYVTGQCLSPSGGLVM